jgi:hypothetical protein
VAPSRDNTDQNQNQNDNKDCPERHDFSPLITFALLGSAPAHEAFVPSEWLFQRCRDLVEELLRALVDVLGWVALLPAGCFAALRVAVADRFLDETFAVTRVEELLRALIGVFRLGPPLLREGCFAALWDTEVDRFLGEAFAIPRLDTVAALVFELRFFPPRVFFLPARLSTKAVTALDATSIAAFTFAVAALAIASSAAAPRPSFSISMSIIMPSPVVSQVSVTLWAGQSRLQKTCASFGPLTVLRGLRDARSAE